MVARVSVTQLRRAALAWYRRDGRDLPWRRTGDPYAILVSEVMLQQTQVDRVVPKFDEFMRRFPTVSSLAAASLADVLRAWSGLGYNGRARRLWECALTVVRSRGGHFPRDPSELESLPGIGPYTAGALVSFAFGGRAACVDTNIRRVLCRAIDGRDKRDLARGWELARRALPRGASGEWNQALMDIGALFCRARPRCDACPVRRHCRGSGKTSRLERERPDRSNASYKDSRRYYRGRVVKALGAAPSLSFMALGSEVKLGFAKSDLPWLTGLLEELQRDGLVTIDRRRRAVRLG